MEKIFKIMEIIYKKLAEHITRKIKISSQKECPDNFMAWHEQVEKECLKRTEKLCKNINISMKFSDFYGNTCFWLIFLFGDFHEQKNGAYHSTASMLEETFITMLYLYIIYVLPTQTIIPRIIAIETKKLEAELKRKISKKNDGEIENISSIKNCSFLYVNVAILIVIMIFASIFIIKMGITRNTIPFALMVLPLYYSNSILIVRHLSDYINPGSRLKEKIRIEKTSANALPAPI